MNQLYLFAQAQLWHNYLIFVKEIFTHKANYTQAEKLAIASQIRRVGILVLSDIAKGSPRSGQRGAANFTLTLAQDSWSL